MYRRWRATQLGKVTDRLETELIRTLLGDMEGRTVLDVGCGDGALTLWLHQNGARAHGVDSSADMLAAAQERFQAAGATIPLYEAEAQSLPFDADSFDGVTAITILCFAKDARPAFDEIYRVLQPGGFFLIGELGRFSSWAAWRRLRAWCGSELWRQGHFRTASELTRLAQQAGFEVTGLKGSIFYPPIGILAWLMEKTDRWLSRRATKGAAFLLLTATKPQSTA